MYKNLGEYIDLLEKHGELSRIGTRVDPVLEIAEITERVSKIAGGGKALLFENTGTPFPVLTNMFGSDRRMALALGVDSLDEISVRIRQMLDRVMSPKDSLAGKLGMLPLLGEMSRWFPRLSSRRGECQQVVLTGADARLGMLPVLKCRPYDGGRFITLPMVNTADSETGLRNVGMYRMQITGEHTTGMHWHVHKTGERHYRSYRKRGERMPVSVCLGGDPVYTYAATAPMPDNFDEYLLAGFLRRRPMKLVRCLTNNLYVPSDCDFVIEGYVDPSQEKFVEGPFGDHTGFYSLEDLYPEFHVTAITHRRDAVYPATITGIPPQEDAFIAKATEKIFLEPIRLAVQSEISDLYMPAEGVAHNLAIASIEKTYDGQAFKVASSMWGAGQMMFNKILIVVPAGTDIRRTPALAPLFRNTDLERDVMFSRGVLDILDHSTATTGTGGKMVIDLTPAREGSERTLSAGLGAAEIPPWVESCDDRLVPEWGILILRSVPGGDADLEGFAMSFEREDAGIKYIVLTDTATASFTYGELLWHAAGNTDPARDIRITNGIMTVDARSKTPYRNGYPRRFPNVVTASEETVALVDRRWTEYGLGEFMESPSRRYFHLLFGEGAEANMP